MKLVRVPILDTDRAAIRARLDCAIRTPVTEAQIGSLCDIPALLAEIKQLLRTEENNRREFADLLAAARAALADLDGCHAESLMQLHVVVGLHCDITAEELDQWSEPSWSCSDERAGTGASGGNSRYPSPDRPSVQHRDCSRHPLYERCTSTKHDPDRKEALTN